MTLQSKQAEIARVGAKSLQKTIEALLVIVAMLFVSAFLPQFLIRYLYASQQLFEQPKLLEYLPVGTFVIGIGYFLFVLVGNFMRGRKMAQLEQELRDMELSGDCCGCGCDSCDADWMKDMDDEWQEDSDKMDEVKPAAKSVKSKSSKKKSK
jgi:hypothetical protein